MASLEDLAATLRRVVTPGMKPKELRAAIREKHPDASKKEIVRAAFFALTEVSAVDREALSDLHNFALGERGHEDETEVAVRKRRSKKKRNAGRAAAEAHS